MSTELTVQRDETRLILMSPAGSQTTTMLDGGPTGLYYDSATDLLQGRSVRSTVLLGLGGGEMLRQVDASHPHTELVGVDIDPKAIHFARSAFKIPAIMVEADALVWVAAVKGVSYSVVMVDLYNDSALVPGTAGFTFLAGCHRLLEPGGMFLMNVFPATRADEVERELSKLYVKVGRRSYGPNIVLFAERTEHACL